MYSVLGPLASRVLGRARFRDESLNMKRQLFDATFSMANGFANKTTQLQYFC